MSEFTLYNFQCCPIRPHIPRDKNSQVFGVGDLEALDKQVLDNMTYHQDIIDQILTKDLERYFENQKKSLKNKGQLEKCLAFFYNGKRYYFKVLLPHKDSMSNGIYMIRIANPRRSPREVDFVRMLQPDEPSALVIIDNRKDQQRILIERTRAWRDTDSVRNILQSCIGDVLRKRYNLGIRIEPVWQKNTFENIVRSYGERIKMVEFYVGYPNMGRTGNVFLNPLKESLRDTYASGTVRYTVPKPADLGMKPKRKKKDEPVNPADEPRKTLALQPDELDPVMNEMAEHCRTTGLPMKFGLIDGHQLILGRVPEAQLKRMTPDQRKLYEAVNEVYSTYTARMNDKVSQFDGQDDLFHGIEEIVTEKLNELKEVGA